MGKRVITSVLGIPLLLLIGISGGFVLQATVLAIVLIGMYEVYRAMSGKHLTIHFVGYFFATLYIVFINYFAHKNGMMALLALLTLSVLVAAVLFNTKINVRDIAVTIFGFIYVAILLSFVYLVRVGPGGVYVVWLIFICAWGCDTGAYFTGKAIGRHKLIQSLSPNKTVEGAIGGVVAATVLGAVYGYALYYFFSDIHIDIVLQYAIISAAGSVLAQFGDLSASAIKRYTKIKDFGRILPGHGGILDRFDSILFTAPAVYILMTLLSKR